MLFEEESAQVTPPAVPEAPVEKVAVEEVPSETSVDETPSFDSSAASEASDQADEMRTWTDNTGKYTVRARLVQVLDGKVRLQKESGRFTTVSFERLSKADLALVQNRVPTIASNAIDRGAEF
jgi:uncharacterized cupin superfamily protein